MIGGSGQAGITPIILIRGGGDLGTGCAVRLTRCGLRVVVVEQAQPTSVRRTVAFSQAVYDGLIQVEEIRAILVRGGDEARAAWASNHVPVAVDPEMRLRFELEPAIIVDAQMHKQNRGMSIGLAPGTIGLGPGFVAGSDVDTVVETNRGPDLGRVIWRGSAHPNTSVPGAVDGHTSDRVLRAPRAGVLHAVHAISDIVDQGEIVAEVGGAPVLAPFRGLLRGLARQDLIVGAGMKIGDLDPRLDPDLCYRVSDKALAVAGGVVEATFMLLRR